jgi:hypothetical protein
MMKMTPRELELAYRGYRRREDERKELIRMQCYYSIVAHVTNIDEPSDIKLPGDKVEKKKLTPIKITYLDG